MMETRPSLAGTWYPAQADQLVQTLDEYFQAADTHPETAGEIIGLIVPHAGHRFCGRVAAQAYSVLPDSPPKRVVIISPLHRYHPSALLTTGYHAYRTPLGLVEVDHELLEQASSVLSSESGIEIGTLLDSKEHAIEVELPFLQRRYGEVSVLPIMMADQSKMTIQALSRALQQVLPQQGGLLIASSDLSHYRSKQEAEAMDREMMSRIASLDPDLVLQAQEKHVAYACGVGAIATVMTTARALGANHVKVLEYTTSAEVTGDSSSVVGYGSAALLRT